MPKYLLDAHAWIEYFLGTDRGRAVRRVLAEKQNTIFVADSTIAELLSWAIREQKNFPKMMSVINNRAKIVDVYLDIWLEASKEKQTARTKGKKDFGMMDALLLANQRHTDAIIVSGDPHFKGMKNVLII